ncbi:MAG TPA: thioesterase family protein [Myxococcota bacterium]|nr:thioesterase family protein [Myxococcota bacterium]
MPRFPSSPPAGVRTSTVAYRVPFYDTDAMRVVHHARYVHYLELARIVFLDEHDRPYRDYVAEGLHYAVTRVEIEYQMAARFDDRLEITCWLDWLKRVSLQIGYTIRRGSDLIATAVTEHAMVSDEGKLTPIPPARRAVLAALRPSS